MLKLANDGLDVIRGDCHLQSAMALDKGKWLCHPVHGDHMVMFHYINGILTISMGESEYELSQAHQIIAFDDNLVYAVKEITFKQILDLLNWTCNDYID